MAYTREGTMRLLTHAAQYCWNDYIQDWPASLTAFCIIVTAIEQVKCKPAPIPPRYDDVYLRGMAQLND